MLHQTLRRHSKAEEEEAEEEGKWASAKERGATNKGKEGREGKIAAAILLVLLIGLFMVSKIRDSRALAIARQDRDHQLTVYRILMDREKNRVMDMREKLEEQKEKTESCRNEKSRLNDKVMQAETIISELRTKQAELQEVLREKQNKLVAMEDDAINVSVELASLRELIQQEQSNKDGKPDVANEEKQDDIEKVNGEEKLENGEKVNVSNEEKREEVEKIAVKEEVKNVESEKVNDAEAHEQRQGKKVNVNGEQEGQQLYHKEEDQEKKLLSQDGKLNDYGEEDQEQKVNAREEEFQEQDKKVNLTVGEEKSPPSGVNHKKEYEGQFALSVSNVEQVQKVNTTKGENKGVDETNQTLSPKVNETEKEQKLILGHAPKVNETEIKDVKKGDGETSKEGKSIAGELQSSNDEEEKIPSEDTESRRRRRRSRRKKAKSERSVIHGGAADTQPGDTGQEPREDGIDKENHISWRR